MLRDPWASGIGSGRGGRFGLLGRVLGDGENPLRWGVPLGRVAGARLRVHWVFVLFVLWQVVFTLPRHQAGIQFVLPLMGALFVLVLAHEIGHAAACRRLGGTAGEMVLWPLGGLSACDAGRGWRGELMVALAGPAVNLALAVPLVGALAAATGSWSAVAPHPLDLGRSVLAVETAYGSMPWWLIGLWSLHAANLTVLAFNLLLPVMPLDAARVLRALVWRRTGPARSLWIAAHASLAASLGVAVVGLVLTDGKALLALGVFGAALSWAERRRVQFLAGVEPGLDVPVASEPSAAEPQEDPAGADRAEVDRILAKISEVGMGGLTARERRVLKRATERSRETERPGVGSEQ